MYCLLNWSSGLSVCLTSRTLFLTNPDTSLDHCNYNQFVTTLLTPLNFFQCTGRCSSGDLQTRARRCFTVPVAPGQGGEGGQWPVSTATHFWGSSCPPLTDTINTRSHTDIVIINLNVIHTTGQARGWPSL